MTGLTYGGDAIGRLQDGRAVFVPFGLPGEEVKVRLVIEKRGHVRAELVEILTASPERIKPVCRHFGICGGCHYQHLSYTAQLVAKTAILHEQLERIGGVMDPPVSSCIPSPIEWNYRNHIQFHLTYEGRLGYLAPDSHTVIPIQECYLPENLLNTIWPMLELEPIPGLERIDLRAGENDEVMLVLEGKDLQAPELALELPLSVVYRGPETSSVLAGDETLVMGVLGKSFRVSSGSFFQVNTRMAAAMVQFILDSLPLSPQTTVLDVYCGVGLFSAFLAERTGRLVGIEVSPEACDDFVVNLDQFDNVELYQGAAEAILPSLAISPDIVVLDPPRAGMDRRALEAIVEKHPAWIAYVSCDPATLARDVQRLIQNGYRLAQATPFDLFPQTYHIESICLLQA